MLKPCCFENEDKAAVLMVRVQLQLLSLFIRTKIGSETYLRNVVFESCIFDFRQAILYLFDRTCTSQFEIEMLNMLILGM